MSNISFSYRWKLWLLAWGLTVLAIGVPYPGLILWFWMFPFGLTEAMGWKRSGDYILGWLLYIALTIAALYTRRSFLYFTLYVILCILLLLNVFGCHKIALGLKDLH